MRHEKEIKYWADHEDGTGVWVRDSKESWSLRETPCWLKGATYIVDDEWAELRKANVDGATIQFNRECDIWEDMSQDWWKEGFYADVFVGRTPTKYRIKPKEWYDQLDPYQDVICWIWNRGDVKQLGVVVGYKVREKKPFRIIGHNGTFEYYEYAEPVKPEECWQGD